MAIIGIVAIAKNFAIGKNGQLPWHYPADLKFFKQTTTGNAVVMGRTTYESIGKALPKRLNIILSRTAEQVGTPGIFLLRSKEDVLALNEYLKSDLFVLGGAKTFAEFAPEIDRWIVTEIPETIADADAFLPAGFLDEFKLEEAKDLEDNLTVKFYSRRTTL